MCWAVRCGKLIVNLEPEGYDETSVDLHLGSLADVRVWDTAALAQAERSRGASRGDEPPEVHIGGFDWESFVQHQVPVPELNTNPQRAAEQLVYRRGQEVVVRRFGFLLWPTRETVGTPTMDLTQPNTLRRHPELICFVNAKSTRARTGLLVHFTAPTIHANWAGKIVLEIANLGPFTFVLKEGDPLAQLTVATISSAPDLELKRSRSLTQGQTDPSGAPRPPGCSSSPRWAGFSSTKDSIRPVLPRRASRTLTRSSGVRAAESSGLARSPGSTRRRWFTKPISVRCSLKNSTRSCWLSSMGGHLS
jgi:dCTP deaminase